MFYGTSWQFRILYYNTSMLPGYLLYIVNLIYTFPVLESMKSLVKNLNGKIIVLIALLMFFLWVRYMSPSKLKKILINSSASNGGVGEVADPNNKYKILSYNGETVSYLMGVIIPSIIILESSMVLSIIIFIILHITIYKIIMNTSDIFPNVTMIIFKKMYVLECVKLDEKINSNNEIYIIAFLDNKSNFPFNNKIIKNTSLTRISESPGEVYIYEATNNH